MNVRDILLVHQHKFTWIGQEGHELPIYTEEDTQFCEENFLQKSPAPTVNDASCSCVGHGIYCGKSKNHARNAHAHGHKEGDDNSNSPWIPGRSLAYLCGWRQFTSNKKGSNNYCRLLQNKIRFSCPILTLTPEVGYSTHVQVPPLDHVDKERS